MELARWQTRGGAHWVELYCDSYGYSYRARGAMGFLGKLDGDDITAIGLMELRLADFAPDKAKTPMIRVF